MKAKTVFILLIIISSTSLHAQSICDYFIPSRTTLKHGFVDKNGKKDEKMHKVYRFGTAPGGLQQMTEASVFEGMIVSSSTKILNITDGMVAVTTESVTDAFSSKPTIVFHDNTILLKLPKEGETEKWSTPGKKSRLSGKTDPPTNYTASLTIMDVNGEKRKAIKVIALTDLGDERFEQVSYYVQGIGLYRVDGISKGKPFTIHEFMGFE